MDQIADLSGECVVCKGPIVDRDLALRDEGKWYHVRCARTRTTPAILCVICRTGIGGIPDLVLTVSGPAHICCQPVESNGSKIQRAGVARIPTDEP